MLFARDVRSLLGKVAVVLVAVACSDSAPLETGPQRPNFWAVEPTQCFRLTGGGRIDQPEPATATSQSKNKSNDFATFGLQSRQDDEKTTGSGQIEWEEHSRQAPFGGFSFSGRVTSFATVENHYRDQSGQRDPVCGQFSGRGRLRGRDRSQLFDVSFIVEHACDEGERGVGRDHIRMIIGDGTYDRAGILTGGNIEKHRVKNANACAPAPTTGDLTVSNTTTPTDLSFSYTVTVDQATSPISQAMPTNQSVTFKGLAAGNHTVDLLNVPTNCEVKWGTSQTVTVPAGGAVSTSFDVTCTVAPTTGNLTVTTSTVCSAGVTCPTSYTVTVDAETPQPISQSIAANDATGVTFVGLAAGSHSVTLSGTDACGVGPANPQTVTVPAGGAVTTNFTVNCQPV